MKNFVLAAAAATALFATPAMATGFVGPRIEATAGYNDVNNVSGNRGFSYGVSAGYDVKLVGPLTVGVEAGLDNVFDRADINVGARIGAALNNHTLAFVDAGYDNYRNLASHNLNGLRVGGGLQVNVLGPVYGTVEYHHTDLGGTHKNAVAAGVGVRF